MILGSNILIFIGIILMFESILSIIFHFEVDSFWHTFRAIRAVLGFYLVSRGVTYSVYHTIGLFWSQVAFFAIVGLSILTGFGAAKVLKYKKNEQTPHEEII